jgi:hypothetical protein
MVKKKPYKQPTISARKMPVSRSSYKSPRVPQGLGIPERKATPTIGSLIDTNRSLGGASGKHIKAARSSIATMRTREKRAASGIWGSRRGKGLATRVGQQKLRSKLAGLPRLRVN